MIANQRISIVAARRYAYMFIFALILAFRIFITSDRDIIATYSPYDEFWYVDAALRRIIGGQYHHMAFAHLPVYAIWLMILADFGIPARLAIDVAWVVGSAYFGFAVAELSKKPWSGFLALILLLFHPYSLVLFDRALAETFLTAVIVITLAAGLEIWNTRYDRIVSRRRVVAIILFCVGFSVAYHTRKEGFILSLPIVAIAAITWIRRCDWTPAVTYRQVVLPLVIFPIFTTVSLGGVLSSVNYFRWGTFARYELANPQYIRAINAINAVDPGASTPRYVTVTAAMREIAYQASPTFAELRPYFNGGIGKNLERMTTEMTPTVTGEIGDWVFYWAIRDAAAAAGWHTSAVAAEVKYKQVADELEQAFSTAKIQRRRVLASFIDPDWSKWIRFLPASIVGELGLVLVPSVSTANLGVSIENAGSKQFADYSLLLGRRRVPLHPESIGWVTSAKGGLIGFIGEGGTARSWTLLDGNERTDVAGAIPFSIHGTDVAPTKAIQIRLPTGKVGQVNVSDLAVGRILDVAGLEDVRIGIEHLFLPPVFKLKPRLERLSEYLDANRSDAVLRVLSKTWSILNILLLALTIFAFLVAMIKKHLNIMLAVTLLGAIYVVSRATLFGVIDASAWYGLASRYMFPAIPLFVATIIFGAVEFVNCINEWITSRRKKVVPESDC